MSAYSPRTCGCDVAFGAGRLGAKLQWASGSARRPGPTESSHLGAPRVDGVLLGLGRSSRGGCLVLLGTAKALTADVPGRGWEGGRLQWRLSPCRQLAGWRCVL